MSDEDQREIAESPNGTQDQADQNGTVKIKELRSLKRRMRFVYHCFRFSKNNQKWLRQYYHEFIMLCGGYKEWGKVIPQVRIAWETSANSFSRMYGLVIAWCKQNQNFNVKGDGKVGKDEEKGLNDVIKDAIKDNIKNSLKEMLELKGPEGTSGSDQGNTAEEQQNQERVKVFVSHVSEDQVRNVLKDVLSGYAVGEADIKKAIEIKEEVQKRLQN